MLGLAIIFGAIVGFALGLTGGGGGIFAVPLLVYGLAVAPREAVGISLASVGGTAFLGAVPRLKRGEVEFRTGVIFAVASMIGAPIGNGLSKLIPESVLLVLFSGLMLVVASRMWSKAKPVELASDPALPSHKNGWRCERDAVGKLLLTPSCITLLGTLGVLTGIMSGLFGVGGGFIIVPALVLFSGMEIHNAVATSLMVIFLTSISGVSSYVLFGGQLSWQLTGLFILGGFFGMILGSGLSRRLSGPRLQRVFAAAVILVAIFVVVKSIASMV